MWSHSSSSQASSVSRPRVVGDAVIIGKATVLARRVARSGCWEVEKPHPVALSRLLTMAYGKRISSGSDMVKLLEKAFTTLPRNLREADQLISALPEPLVEAEDRVEAANRLLKDGVSPYHLEEALRGEQFGLRPAPAWAERLTLCDKGVVLGKGTVIVGLTDDGLDLEGKEGDVLALLSLARRSLAPIETLEKLASVSRAVMAGDISVAAITLAQLGQPPLQDTELAKSLTFAANKLKRGVKPLELLKRAGFSMQRLEKAYGKSAAWDESLHPRDEKGRFGNGNGGGSSGSDASTPAVDGRNLDTSDLSGRYGTDVSSTAPGKYSIEQQYAANEAGTKNDASGEKQWKEAWKGQPNEKMREFFADQEQSDKRQASHGYDEFRKNTNGDNALGRYQLTYTALTDIGVMERSGKWGNTEFASKFNIKSDSDFLNNETAQEYAMTLYIERLQGFVDEYADEYVGDTFTGISGQKIKITMAGLIAAAHRRGAGTLEAYLTKYKGQDTRGKALSTKEKEIETRLRLGQDIPYLSP